MRFWSLLIFSIFLGVHLQAQNNPQTVVSPTLPRQLQFAGEDVPLNLFDVRESLEREIIVNMFLQSQTLQIIKLANRYESQIRKILKSRNIPEDFVYLCAAESGFKHQAYSGSKAASFWQFLEATGKSYDLTVNEDIDERYHIEKATIAACNYLEGAKQMFGNWTMAAASYNVGRTGLDRQARMQHTYNYYDLRLNEETGRYIYRILALKLILSNPQAYGFEVNAKDLYPPFQTQTIQVDTTVNDLAAFAIQQGSNYKMLKLMNPWLRSNKLPVEKGKPVFIELPMTGFRENAYERPE
jgi:hypothetical protein